MPVAIVRHWRRGAAIRPACRGARALTAFAYAASYWYFISRRLRTARYTVHGISNTPVRTTVTGIQTLDAG
jgi:hypothetical protein